MAHLGDGYFFDDRLASGSDNHDGPNETGSKIEDFGNDVKGFSDCLEKRLHSPIERVFEVLTSQDGFPFIASAVRFTFVAPLIGKTNRSGYDLAIITYFFSASIIDISRYAFPVIIDSFKTDAPYRDPHPFSFPCFEKSVLNIGKRIFYDGPKGFFDSHSGRKERLDRPEMPYREIKAVSVE